jgi:hypothetical protein
MSKIAVLKELDKYFKEKGKVLTYNEYIQQEDAPVRVHIIKRVVGPWGRMERLLGKIPAEVVVSVGVEAVEAAPAPIEAPVAEPAEEPVAEAPKTAKKK